MSTCVRKQPNDKLISKQSPCQRNFNLIIIKYWFVGLYFHKLFNITFKVKRKIFVVFAFTREQMFVLNKNIQIAQDYQHLFTSPFLISTHISFFPQKHLFMIMKSVFIRSQYAWKHILFMIQFLRYLSQNHLSEKLHFISFFFCSVDRLCDGMITFCGYDSNNLL